MKQLLLLLTIHFLIFHQRGKYKKEKFLITLEKKSEVSIKQQKNWNFLRHIQDDDSLYFNQPTDPIAYNLGDYSYLYAR